MRVLQPASAIALKSDPAQGSMLQSALANKRGPLKPVPMVSRQLNCNLSPGQKLSPTLLPARTYASRRRHTNVTRSATDVAIVGGGPAGLAIATGIRKVAPEVSVQVFERAPILEPKGAGLNLAINGLKALRAVSPEAYKIIQDQATYPIDLVILDAQGKEVKRSSQVAQREEEQQTYGIHNLFIGWFELQQALFQQVPVGLVQLGHRFEKYTLQDGHVSLKFRGAPDEVQAKLVIGCDGYFSGVRQQWLGDGPPVYGNAVMFRGRLPASQTKLPSEPCSYFIGQPGKISLMYPGSKGQVVWVASIQQDALDKLQLKDEASLKQSCLEAFAEFPPFLLDLVVATADSSIVKHEVRYRHPASYPVGQLGTGPITVAGDAAHALRPTGQGTSLALEDAVVLAQMIRELGVTEDALRAYEAVRLPRWRDVSWVTSELGGNAYGKGTFSDEANVAAKFMRELYSTDFSL